MKITLNGQSRNIANTARLNHLIEQFCKGALPVIAEVNGNIVRRPQWAEQPISEGDTIELINIVGGG